MKIYLNAIVCQFAEITLSALLHIIVHKTDERILVIHYFVSQIVTQTPAMRNATFVLLLMGLLVTGSCNKGQQSNSGGSWTFKGVTYVVRFCSASSSSATLTAMDSVYTGVAGSVNVVFLNNLPQGSPSHPVYGTYTVVKGTSPTKPYEVAIFSYIGPSQLGPMYQSTGGNGLQTVSVSVSNGKINLTGSGIELSDTTNPSDSGALTFNITQLQ